MKQEVTFEQVIGLLDTAIELATENPYDGIVRVPINDNFWAHIIIGSSTKSKPGYIYNIQYNASTKLIALTDCVAFTKWNIYINNSQEDIFRDKVNKLEKLWCDNSINSLNNFIYASKK